MDVIYKCIYLYMYTLGLINVLEGIWNTYKVDLSDTSLIKYLLQPPTKKEGRNRIRYDKLKEYNPTLVVAVVKPNQSYMRTIKWKQPTQTIYVKNKAIIKWWKRNDGKRKIIWRNRHIIYCGNFFN